MAPAAGKPLLNSRSGRIAALVLGGPLLLGAMLYFLALVGSSGPEPAKDAQRTHTSGPAEADGGAADAGVDGSIASTNADQVVPFGAHVMGRILNSEGEPVAGAVLELRGTTRAGGVFGLAGPGAETAPRHGLETAFEPALADLGNLGTTRGDVPPISAAGQATSVPLRGADQAQLVSGVDGTFDIPGVPKGSMRLLAHHPDYAPARSEAFEIATEADRPALTVTLPPPGFVHGRVTDDTGSPLPDVQVALDSDALRMPMLTLTSADGSFELGPVAGPCELRAVPVSGPAVSRELEVPSGETLQVEVVLHSGELALSGQLESPRGDAVNAALLALRPAGHGDHEALTVPANADGSFELSGLSAGAYALDVSAPGYASRHDVPITLPREQPLKLTLYPGLTLVGTVSDEASGAPLAGVSLRVAGKNTSSDSSGSFMIFGLSSGNHELVATKLDFTPNAMSISMAPRPFDRPTRIEVHMAAGATLAGNVVDRYGTPVADATVVLDGPRTLTTRTGVDGRFSLEAIGEGNYGLSARHPSAGHGTLDHTLDVRPGRGARNLVVRLSGRAEAERGSTSAAAASDPAATEEASTAPPASRMFTLPAVTLDNVGPHVQVVSGEGILRDGDRIHSINGETVYSAAQARSMLRGRPGTTVTVVFSRGGTRLRRSLTRP